MKSKFIAVLCVFALFIPTYIAVFAYMSEQNSPVNINKVDKVEIFDLYQNVFEYTTVSDGKETIDFILDMNSRATTVAALPDQLMSSDFFKISFFEGSKEVVYKYYFSVAAADSYFLDDKGTVFKVKPEDATQFINMECMQSLYASSVPPALHTSENNIVTPKLIAWSYKNSSDSYTEVSGLKTSQLVVTYDMLGAVDFDFAIEPDMLTAKIYKNDELLYDGIYNEFTGLAITERTSYNIVLDAKWYQDSARDYYGQATYEFIADISAPAAFSLGKTSIEPGEFTVLTGINVADVSKIKFTAEPAISHESKTFTPTFFKDGDYVHALIPTTYESTAQSYELTLEYGAVKQTLTLNMKPRVFGASSISPSNTILNKTRTAETIAAFEQAVAEAATTGDATRYWDGKFIQAVSGGVIRAGYGRYRTITTTGEVYRHNGVDYAINVGTNLYAINSGKVIYTGVLDYTGNIVIIQHGYGLKSWYCHMSQISVSVGDMVNKGDVIGKSGNTGFVEFAVAHIGLSVFDYPVCQYALWEEEIAINTEH